MERPTGEVSRSAYQSQVQGHLEFLQGSPHFRVEPWGLGGAVRKVKDCTREQLLAVARRWAETDMNRAIRKYGPIEV